MSVLVIAEHDHKTLKTTTNVAVQAGLKLGAVTVCVTGRGCADVAQQASELEGVKAVWS